MSGASWHLYIKCCWVVKYHFHFVVHSFFVASEKKASTTLVKNWEPPMCKLPSTRRRQQFTVVQLLFTVYQCPTHKMLPLQYDSRQCHSLQLVIVQWHFDDMLPLVLGVCELSSTRKFTSICKLPCTGTLSCSLRNLQNVATAVLHCSTVYCCALLSIESLHCSALYYSACPFCCSIMNLNCAMLHTVYHCIMDKSVRTRENNYF